MIDIQDLCFAYPGKPAIFDRFSWSVAPGESWAVIGPSGCGKSTLLYLVAGLRLANCGSLLVAGAPVIKPRRTTGLILQDFGLLPWATAIENITLGLKIRGVSAREQRRVADEWLERLGLSKVAHHYPSQLSGGQRQRVAIARTLALEPTLLLMDEPFNSLDALTREELQNLLVDLGVEQTITTVLVTHSIEEAVFLGRMIIVFPQPPISRGMVVANPAAGRLGYRREPEFYRRCSEVRQLVEEMVHAPA